MGNQIDLPDMLKDFDNGNDENGERRYHSISFITMNGNLKTYKKCYRIGLPQRVAAEKTLRNIRCAETDEECLFNFRLLVSFNDMKLIY